MVHNILINFDLINRKYISLLCLPVGIGILFYLPFFYFWSKFQKSSSYYFRKWAALSFELRIIKIRRVITKLREWPKKTKKGPGARGWSKFQKSSSYYLRKWVALSFELWTIKIRWVITKLFEFLLKVLQWTDGRADNFRYFWSVSDDESNDI